MKNISRRSLIKKGALVGAGTSLLGNHVLSAVLSREESDKPVRIAIVGTGGRGTSLLQVLLNMKGIEVPALCDINLENLENASTMCEKLGYNKPKGYSDDEYSWVKLLDDEKLDAVIIATPWKWHTPIAVYAMKRGVYPGIEVPAALTVEECWELVNTSEDTGVPCMMLENWSFRPDNLAVLNMIREGLFGEMIHSHCAHSHDCLGHWFYKKKWPFKYLETHNGDLYPTHQLGPVLSWLDINCGDGFDYITSTATDTFGPVDYFERLKGKGHPLADKKRYTQGDIVTTVIKTKKGKTIVSNYDMQLPRPYDNRWMIQGTRGLYSETKDSVYMQGNKISTKGEEWEPFAPYHEKYKHKWAELSTGSHGGADGIMFNLFVNAVRHKLPTPLDVYDSAIMSVIFDLSAKSIAQGSKPVKVPDFTRGKWETRKPYFGI